MSILVPTSSDYYRPLSLLEFWAEQRIFGYNASAFHVVALVYHIGSSSLIYLVARRLGSRRLGASLGALAFLVGIHAHEVVWWAGDYQYAPCAFFVLASVYAYLAGRRAVSVLLAAAALLAGEPGVLVLPFLGLYEVLFAAGHFQRRLMAALKAVVPYAAVIATYLAIRIAATQRFAFHNETVPCHSARCIAQGTVEYFTRLFVRPDRVLSVLWAHRPAFLLALLAATFTVVWLLRPWRGANWRSVLYAAGLTAIASLFFVLTLWPYVADRFLYFPDIGFALVLAVLANEAQASLSAGHGAYKLAASIVLALIVCWIAIAPYMLWQRALLWDEAGTQAQTIVDGVVRLLPTLPANSTLVLVNVPDSHYPAIPPGNSGPYVFRNALDAAIRLRYGRDDLVCVWRPDQSTDGRSPTTTFNLKVRNDGVQLISAG